MFNSTTTYFARNIEDQTIILIFCIFFIHLQYNYISNITIIGINPYLIRIYLLSIRLRILLLSIRLATYVCSARNDFLEILWEDDLWRNVSYILVAVSVLCTTDIMNFNPINTPNTQHNVVKHLNMIHTLPCV